MNRHLRFVLVLGLLSCVGCAGDGRSPSTEAAGIPPTSTATTLPASTTVSATLALPTSTTASGEIFCDQPAVEPGAGESMFSLYEICSEGQGRGERSLAGLQPVERSVTDIGVPLVAALGALLAGPTPEEEAAGFGSWFSSATAGALLEASVDTNGVAVIDLDADLITGIDNVSTTTGGDYFRGQLYGTVFAFEEVTEVLFSLDGSSSGFCAMMELIPDCVPVSRSQWDEIYWQTVER